MFHFRRKLAGSSCLTATFATISAGLVSAADARDLWKNLRAAGEPAKNKQSTQIANPPKASTLETSSATYVVGQQDIEHNLGVLLDRSYGAVAPGVKSRGTRGFIPGLDGFAGDKKWQPHVEFTAAPGGKRTLGQVNLFAPLAQDADSLFFADLRASAWTGNVQEGNFGAGYREIVPGGFFGTDAIFGVYGFFDARRSSYGNMFYQGTFGAELITERFEFRANGYLPTGTQYVVGTVGSGVALNGVNIVSTGTDLVERALPGFDIEAGVKFDFSEAAIRLNAGYFRFERGDTLVEGPRFRAEVEFDEPFGFQDAKLSFGGEIRTDKVRGTEASGIVRLRMPLGGSSGSSETERNLTGLDRLMMRRVYRDEDIVTPVVRAANTQTLAPVTDAASGESLQAFFVANTAQGAADCSSVANACEFSTAQGLAGAGDTFLPVDVAGAISGTFTLNNHRQQVVGAGDSGSATLVLSDSASSVLIVTSLGGRPIVTGINFGHFADTRIAGLTTNSAIGITGSAFAGSATIDDVRTINGGLNFANSAAAVTVADTIINNGANPGIVLTGMTGNGSFANVDVVSAGGVGLSIDGGSINATFDSKSSFTQSGAAATVEVLDGHSGTITAEATLSASNGTGLQFNNADGSYNFNGPSNFNGGDAGIDILGGSAGVFTFGADTAILSPTGMAFNVSGSAATVNYNGTITQTSAASAISVTNNTDGSVTFGGRVIANTSAATGVNLIGNTGVAVNFSGGLDIDTTTGTGFSATGGGTLSVAATAGVESITSTAGQALDLNGVVLGAGGVTFDSISSTGSGSTGIDINGVSGGAFTVSGAATVSGSTGNAIELTGNSAALAFNGATSITMSNAAAAVDFAGTTGGLVSFANLDIALQSANATGFDLSGAVLDANVTATDFDLTSTSVTGTTGVNLTGTTGTGTIQLGDSNVGGESATIAGVNVGVQFSAASNATFIFGDGEATTDQLSSISATTAIAGGSTVTLGSYDFDDVNFTGTLDFTAGAGVDLVFVAATATGDGTGSDVDNRANVVTADAIVASGTTFVLINDGAAIDDVDGFTLVDGQTLASFGNGRTFTGSGLVIPANFSGVSGAGATIIDPTGNGAATLTRSGGAGDTLIATGTVNLQDFILSNAAAGAGLSATGATSISSTGLTVQNVDGQGIDLDTLTGAASSFTNTVVSTTTGNAVDIVNSTVSFTGGLDIATVDGIGFNATGGGTLSVAASAGTEQIVATGTGTAINLDGVTVAAGGITFDSVTTAATATANGVDINDAAGGTLTLTSVSLGGTAATAGLEISGNARTSNVVVTGGTIANGVAISGSGSGTVTIGASISTSAGYAVQVGNRGAGAGQVDINGAVTSGTGAVSIQSNTAGTVNFGGTVTGTGSNTSGAINIGATTGGTVTFAGLVDIDVTGTGTGVAIANTNAGGTFAFTGGLNINSASGTGFEALSGTVSVAATAGVESITSTAGQALSLENVVLGAGGVTFDSISSTGSGSTGIDINGVSGGAFTVSGAATVSGSTGNAIQLTGTSAALAFNGATSITMSNAAAAVDFAGTAGGAVSFANLDIALQSANATGFDLSGAVIDANVTATDFDLTSTSVTGTTGVNLTGTTGTGTIQLGDSVVAGESAGIAGVGVGVQFSATSNATFIFGDGEGTTDQLSSISATTAIAGGSTVTLGSYDFDDVNFTGTLDFTAGAGVDLVFVAATATGNGTGSDVDNRANVVTADAIVASGTTFVLINDGAAIDDTDGFTLVDGQTLASFGNGRTFTGSGLVIPANFSGVSGAGATIIDPTGNGAATLTRSGGAGDTLIATGTVNLQDFILSNAAAGAGLSATGATSISSTGLTVQNVAGQGIDLDTLTGAASTFANTVVSTTTGNAVDIVNSAVSFTGGLDIATVDGIGFNATGGGTLSVAASAGTEQIVATGTGTAINLDGVTVAAGGINFDSVTTAATATANGVDIDDAAGGTLTLTSVSLGGTAATAGLEISGNARTSNVVVTGGTIANGVAISGSGSGTVTIGASISTSAGYAVQVGNRGAGAGQVDINGAVTSSTGAVSIQSNTAGTVNFGGTVTGTGSNTSGAINIGAATGGTVTFAGLVDIDVTGSGTGVAIANSNAGGSFSFTGGLDINSASGTGFEALSGTVSVAATAGVESITSTAGQALNLENVMLGAGGVTFDSISSTGSGSTGIDINGVSGGAFTVSGAATVSGSTGNAIQMTGNSAALAFNGATSITMSNAAAAVDFAGTTGGAVSFANLDIALQSTNATGFDLSGAVIDANVTATDFDLTSTSVTGTTGVNLTGTTGTGTIQLGDSNVGGESATIAGVNVGVQFSAASNATFIFGDGEATTDQLSSISATTAIAGGSAVTLGSYDFDDVSFTGTLDFTAGAGVDLVFVAATATGNGTGSDVDNRANVVTADAIVTSGTTFVLINDGAAIDDTDGFTLVDGQTLASFGNGRTFTGSGLVIPANFSGVSGAGATIIDPTGNGAATLTRSGGAGDTLIVSGTVNLQDFIIENAAAGAGLSATGATSISSTGLTVQNVAGQGIDLNTLTGAASSFTNTSVSTTTGNAVDIVNSTVSFTGGLDIATVDGIGFNATGGGTLSVAASAGTEQIVATGTGTAINLDGVTVAAGGITFDSVTTAATATANGVDINDAAGGTLTLTSVSLGGTAATAGLEISGNARTSNVVVTGGTIANGVAISGSGSGTVTIGASISTSAGYAVQVGNRGAGAGQVDINGAVTSGTGAVSIQSNTAGTVNFGGTVTGTGSNTSGAINIGATTGGTVTFAGLVDIDVTGTGTGVAIANTNAGGTFAFTGGLDINTVTGTAFQALSGTVNVTGAANTIDVATDGIAFVANQVTLNTTFASINGTRTGAGATLIDIDNVDGTFTLNGGTLNSGVGNTFGTIDIRQNDGAATRSLTANFSGVTIVHDASATIGDDDYGILGLTEGDDTLIIGVDNSIFKTEDQGVFLESTGSLTVTSFLNNTFLGDVTAFNPAFFGNGASFRGVTFDANPATAALDAVSGGTFTSGTSTVSAQGGLGFGGSTYNLAGLLSPTTGTISFTSLNVYASDSSVSGNSSGIVATGNVGGLTLNIAAGSITAPRLDLGDGFGGPNLNVTLDSLTLASDTRSVFVANGATGSFTVTGATSILTRETAFDFGAPNWLRQTANAIDVSNSTANFQFATLAITSSNAAPATNSVVTGGATVGVNLSANTGTFTVTGTTTIADTVEDAIRLTGNTGTVSFGTTNISNAGAAFLISGGVPTFLGGTPETNVAGIDFEGANGQVSFGATTITGVGARSGAKGIDFNGATLGGTVSFESVAISGTGAADAVGVDLRGVTGGQIINMGSQATPATGPSSTIATVGTGVFFDATSNATFIFGDGEATTDQLSSISATTAIAGGSTVTLGSYDFDDVNFTGTLDFTAGAGVDLVFVAANATGTGTGSDVDNRANVVTADAIVASGTTFVLINDGAAINDVDGFTLGDGQTLASFGNGRTFTGSGLVIPANFSGVPGAGATIIDPTGNGAATLTRSGGAGDTLIATGTVNLQDFILSNAAAGAGLSATGATSISSTGLTVQNVAGQGIDLNTLTGAASTFTNTVVSTTTSTAIDIVNSTVSFTGGLDISTTDGTGFSATGGGTVSVAASAGTEQIVTNGVASALNLDGVTVAAGGITFDSVTTAATTTNTGVSINDVAGGTVTLANVNLSGVAGIMYGMTVSGDNRTSDVVVTGGTIVNGILVNNSGTGTVAIGANITSTKTYAVTIANRIVATAGQIDINGTVTSSNDAGVVYMTNNSAGTVNFNATVTGTGTNTNGVINIETTTGGTLTFAGLVDIDVTGTGTGVVIANNNAGGSFSFTGGLDINSASGTGFEALSGTVSVAATAGVESITVGDTTALVLNGVTANVTFDEINATNSAKASVGIDNSDGTFTLNGGTFNTVVTGTDFSTIDINQNDAGATRALTVAISGVTINHDASTTAGGNEFGVHSLTQGDDSLVISIANSNFTTEDQGVMVTSTNGMTTVTDFSDNTLFGDATAFNPAFMQNGVQFGGVVFDSDLSTAGLQEVSGGAFVAGTLAERVSNGVGFNTNIVGLGPVAPANQGTLRFASYDVIASGNGIYVSGNHATATLATDSGTINAAVVNVGGAANLDVTLSTLTLGGGLGSKLLLADVTGSLEVTGATSVTTAGNDNAIQLSGTIGAAISFADLDIALNGDNTIGINFSGATINGNFTANDFDVTSTSATGTVGVNLVGTTGTGTIQLGDTNTNGGGTVTLGSAANMLATGVQVDAATNLSFVLGDGDGALGDLTASNIHATTAISGTLPTNGSYNFRDIAFNASGTANLTGPSIYYVDAAGAGTGGSQTDAGSIAGAETFTGDVIALVDTTQNAGSDAIDMASAPHTSGGAANSLDLDDGQVLIALAAGQSIDLSTLGVTASGAPASFLFTGISGGTSTVTGAASLDSVAPTLTTNAGNTINLAGSAAIQGVTIANSGTGDGINASFGAAESVIIRASTIGATSGDGIDIATTAGASTFDFSALTMSSGLRLDGTAGGTLTGTATGTNTITNAAGIGLYLDTVAIGAAGVTFNSVSSTNAGNTNSGIRLDTLSGAGGVSITTATVVDAGGAGGGDAIHLTNIGMTGALDIANIDIDLPNTSRRGIVSNGGHTSDINLGTGAGGVAIDDALEGIRLNGAAGTISIGTGAGSGGVQLSTINHGILLNTNSSGTINIGTTATASAISAGLDGGAGSGIYSLNSDTTVTATGLDIDSIGGNDSGIELLDNDALGSFTLTGTNTIDNLFTAIAIVNARASISGVTIGASATGPGDRINGHGILITSTDANSRTVSLSNITMGSGGNGDTADVGGIGIDINSSGAGVLTVNLTGTNVIRSTGQALDVDETNGTKAANNLLLSIENTTFERGPAGQTVVIRGQNVSPTTSSIGISSFSRNTVIGNGTAGGITFNKVDFDSDGAGAAVAGGTLDIGQSAGARVSGKGLSLIDPTGDLGFTALTIFNDGNTGLEVNTKGEGTFFNLTNSGGTVDTTNGTALFLDPLTMNLAFGTVTATGGANGVFIDAGDASGGAGANALTINSLNVSLTTGAALRINESTGAFTFGATTINNTTGDGVDLDLGAGDTATVSFINGLDIDTISGTGFDANGSAGTALTVNVTNSGTETIDTTSGTAINTNSATLAATFDSVTSTALSGNDGISLLSTSGTLTINGGTITNTGAGIGIDVGSSTVGTGGNATLNIATAINSSGATGLAVQIKERSGGTVTLSGNLTDDTATGGGIDVSGNNDGGSPVVTFSGTQKQVRTGASSAVVIGSNTGATISFTGGGLDIDTTSGAGFSATGGGTVNVAGAGNSVTTTTGRTLDWDGVSVGASNVTFDTLAASGMVNSDVISINNVDGTGTFNGGNVTVAGTAGVTQTGITISGGSAATFTFASATIDNTPGDAIRLSGANGAVTFTTVDIDNIGTNGIQILNNTSAVTINGGSIGATIEPAADGVRVDGGSGDITIAASVSKTSSGDVVEVTNRSGGTVDISGALSSTGGAGIKVTSNSGGITSFSNASKSLSTGVLNAVTLTNNTGATINFTGGGLDIDTISGAGFSATGGGTVNVSGAGNSIQTSSGTALNLDTVTIGGSGITFGTVNALGLTGNNGINLQSVTGGALTVTSGSIVHAGAGAGVVIGSATNGSGGNATIAIGTDISSAGATGRAVDVQELTGGSITLSGQFFDSNATGGGIRVRNINNGTAASVTFSNTSVQVKTGTQAAVELTGNTNGTVNFTNGGLVIDTTSGTGFTATGGGTVNVQGSGNSVTSTTGTAVNIASTTIGASGVTFASVSANGAATGIVLANTGATGGFTVTGTGTVGGSGGTIENTTGNAIQITGASDIDLRNMVLTSVASSNGVGSSVFGGNIANYVAAIKLSGVTNLSLNNLDINGDESGGVNDNLGQVGISGQTVSGLSITNTTVQNFGNASGEDNIQFQGLTGTVNITNLISRDSGGDLFAIDNTGAGGTVAGGNLTMTVTGSTFDETVNGVGAGGLRLSVNGAGTTNVSVNTTTFGNGTATGSNGGLQGTGLQLDVGRGHVGTLTVEDSVFIGMNVAISGTLDTAGVGAGPELTVNIRDGADAGSDGNTIHTIRSNAINLFTNGGLTAGEGRLDATITGNTIGLENVANSGSQLGNGIRVGNEGGSTVNVRIDNNIVQGVGDGLGNGFEGIRITNNVTASTTNATITNNLIRDIFDDRGILVESLIAGGVVCSNISGNIFSGDIRGDSPFNGTTSVMRVRHTAGTYNVTQTSAANLAAANGIVAANITETGTITYSQPACVLP